MPAAYSPLVRELAEGLVDAIDKDERGEGHDVQAGMLGPHLSLWLRNVASRIDPEHDIMAGVRNLPTLCSACGAQQFTTPSGPSCPNGHGGADGYLPTDNPERQS